MTTRLFRFLAVVFALAAPTSVFAQTGQSAAAASKTYELRVYTAQAGRLADLQTFFRGPGMPLMTRNGVERIFAGTVLEGAATDGADAPNMLVEILEHGSTDAMTKAWTVIEADAAWRSAAALLAKPAVSTPMAVTDFSSVASASTPGAPARVFELRKYNTGVAGLPYTLHRFKVGMAGIIEKAGMTPIGYWTATDNSALAYLVAHPSREAAKIAWSAFLTDYRPFMAEYPKRVDAVPAAPRTPEDNRFLVPTDYSPMR